MLEPEQRRHPSFRWTLREVAQLQALRAHGLTNREIGLLYGVSGGRIGQVLKNYEKESKAAAERELTALAHVVHVRHFYRRWDPELLERAVAAIEARAGSRH